MNKEDLFTTKQVAELLGKSLPSVSQYVKSGKLTPVEDQWGGHRGNLFQKEEVGKLQAELAQQHVGGWMIGEAAAFLGVSRAVVTGYLADRLIPYKEAMWRNRLVKKIAPDDVKVFQQEHKERIERDKRKQRRFFNRRHNQAFFQKYTSDAIRDARLMLDEKDHWGFWLTDEEQIVSYEEGIYRHDLTPAYELSFGKKAATPGYAKMKLPLSSPLTRLFFDALYEQVSIANVYVDIEPEAAVIYVKDALIETGDHTEMMALFLTERIQEGTVESNATHIRLLSPEDTITVTLPAEMKNELKKQAAAEGVTMQDIARTILISHFKKEMPPSR